MSHMTYEFQHFKLVIIQVIQGLSTYENSLLTYWTTLNTHSLREQDLKPFKSSLFFDVHCFLYSFHVSYALQERQDFPTHPNRVDSIHWLKSAPSVLLHFQLFLIWPSTFDAYLGFFQLLPSIDSLFAWPIFHYSFESASDLTLSIA